MNPEGRFLFTPFLHGDTPKIVHFAPICLYLYGLFPHQPFPQHLFNVTAIHNEV